MQRGVIIGRFLCPIAFGFSVKVRRRKWSNSSLPLLRLERKLWSIRHLALVFSPPLKSVNICWVMVGLAVTLPIGQRAVALCRGAYIVKGSLRRVKSLHM